jgi:hypothetical protein
MFFTERTRVTATLDAPCEDVDLFIVDWDEDYCPTEANSVIECEAGTDSGDDTVVIDAFPDDRFLVIVDTPDEAATNFRLSLACEN